MRSFVVAIALSLFVAVPALASQRAPKCDAPAALIDLGANLPRGHVALEERREIVIVALGSSSTQGAGASTPARTYPAQLARALQLALPDQTVHVVNLGRGGERAQSMIDRIETEVAAYSPDLVIWQTGVNDLLQQPDIETMPGLLAEGIRRIRALGADTVLMDVQYAPRVVADAKHGRMMAMLADAARETGAGLHRRFELMEYWAHPGRLGYGALVSDDGLHMTDASYRCTARTLADGLITAWERSRPRLVSRP